MCIYIYVYWYTLYIFCNLHDTVIYSITFKIRWYYDMLIHQDFLIYMMWYEICIMNSDFNLNICSQFSLESVWGNILQVDLCCLFLCCQTTKHKKHRTRMHSFQNYTAWNHLVVDSWPTSLPEYKRYRILKPLLRMIELRIFDLYPQCHILYQWYQCWIITINNR